MSRLRCSRASAFCSMRRARHIVRFHVRSLTALLLLILWAGPARSHDPSAWGGLFRSRDHGATWTSENRGPFVSGAIALAISPTDVDHLLLGTESGLLRSRNGGRDWIVEAPSVVAGPIFGLAFAADGQRALVSTGLGIFRGEAENGWRQAPAPRGATPARAIVRSGTNGRVYLAGSTGLFRSDDWGASWSSIADGLPQEPTAALLVMHGPPETLYAIIQGAIWARVEGARSWARRGPEVPSISVEALAVDSTRSTRLWAAGAGRLFTSDDGGVRWQATGRPLPEPNTTVRGIAAREHAIVVTTERGLYRSVDDGEHWMQITQNVPAHLEAGPLVRDPVDPATLYAGFALVPYPELWERAVHEHPLARVSIVSLAAGVGFLAIVALAAFAALRWLRRYYRSPPRNEPVIHPSRGRPMETTL